jgi:hypothetical protein
MAVVNFYGTTNGANLFGVETLGLVQGEAQPSPFAKYTIASAYVASTVTVPIYGGMLITESISAVDSVVGDSGGGSLIVATGSASATGFIVSNQMYNAVIVAGPSGANAAPFVAPGNTAQIGRFGSGLVMALAINPAAVAGMQGGAINQKVSFDPVNQWITTYSGTLGALPVELLAIEANSKVISVNVASGLPVWSQGPVALVRI